MKKLALMITATLIVASCGGSDDAADALVEQIIEQTDVEGIDLSTGDDGELTLTIEDDEGTAQASFGGDLPADFPFPLPDVYEVGTSMQFDEESGTSYTAVIEVAGDAYDSMKEKYESWLEDEGFTVDTLEMQSNEGNAAFITGEREDVQASVSMSVEEVANDDAGNLTYATFVTLAWMPIG
ncbi:MAG: hypothetical protein DRJ28_00550 [Actinobacteria bacterium]|nr:MAG: hypothetical protein DRJ28_00550 [Actinomycetota bacterium]